MMRGRVAPATADYFERNRLRVLVETDGPDGRTLFYAEKVEGGYRQADEPGVRPAEPMRWPGWYDPRKDADQGGLPEGASPFVLDCQRDVAYAVYKALQEHFENETPVPSAGDRAYADAREDIERMHGLLHRLIDMVE